MSDQNQSSQPLAAPINTTHADFEADVLKSDVPVLVDFWAEWCGPCKMIAPVLDQVASEYAGKVKIVKVNIDDHPQVAGQFAVRSIPTLILFKNGQVETQHVGVISKGKLIATLENSL